MSESGGGAWIFESLRGGTSAPQGLARCRSFKPANPSVVRPHDTHSPIPSLSAPSLCPSQHPSPKDHNPTKDDQKQEIKNEGKLTTRPRIDIAPRRKVEIIPIIHIEGGLDPGVRVVEECFVGYWVRVLGWEGAGVVCYSVNWGVSVGENRWAFMGERGEKAVMGWG